MLRPSRRVALTASICLGLAHGLSLSDFSPTLADVPDPCSSVYMQHITGCSRSDFSGGSGCSESCILGLVNINQELNQACQDFSAPSDSLISLFQQGQGIQVLCKVAVVTAASSQSVPEVGQDTMTLPSSSAPAPSSIIADTNSPPSPTHSSSLTTSTTSTTSAARSSRVIASGSPTSSASASTDTTTTSTTSASITRITAPASSFTRSSATTTTSADTAAGSVVDGNGGTGGDPFAPSGAGIALLPNSFVSVVGLLIGSSLF